MTAVLMKTPTKSSKGYSERHPNEGGLPVASVLPSHGHAQKSDKARTLLITAYYSSARSWLSGEGLDHRQQSTPYCRSRVAATRKSDPRLLALLSSFRVWIEIQWRSKRHAVLLQRCLQFPCLGAEYLVEHPRVT